MNRPNLASRHHAIRASRWASVSPGDSAKVAGAEFVDAGGKEPARSFVAEAIKVRSNNIFFINRRWNGVEIGFQTDWLVAWCVIEISMVHLVLESDCSTGSAAARAFLFVPASAATYCAGNIVV